MVQGNPSNKPDRKQRTPLESIKTLPKHVELRYMGGAYVYTSRG